MERTYYPLTGIEEIYIAEDINDTRTSYSAGTPIYFAPTQTGEWTEEQSSEDIYGDNQLQDTFYGTKKSGLKITLTGVSTEMDAKIRGIYYDSTTGRAYSTGDEDPPYRAIGMKMNKGRGDYTYVWFPKGTFKGGTVKAQTKEDKVTLSTIEYEFSAVSTDCKFVLGDKTKGISWVKGDTTAAAFSGTNWFAQVQTPLTAGIVISALELSSSVPLADVTNAAVSVKPTLTFNNAIASHGVFLINAATGATITTTIAFDSAGKIMTITPAANLTAATKYGIVVSGVKDVYGQALANTVRYFTTV